MRLCQDRVQLGPPRKLLQCSKVTPIGQPSWSRRPIGNADAYMPSMSTMASQCLNTHGLIPLQKQGAIAEEKQRWPSALQSCLSDTGIEVSPQSAVRLVLLVAASVSFGHSPTCKKLQCIVKMSLHSPRDAVAHVDNFAVGGRLICPEVN
eukprot:3714044-Amphidinium_carterae.1